MNNEIQNQQPKQKPAQGASSKAGRGKSKGIPRGVWKEIPLNKLRRWEKNVRTPEPKPQRPSKPPEMVPAPDVKRMSNNAPSNDKRPDDWE